MCLMKSLCRFSVMNALDLSHKEDSFSKEEIFYRRTFFVVVICSVYYRRVMIETVSCAHDGFGHHATMFPNTFEAPAATAAAAAGNFKVMGKAGIMAQSGPEADKAAASYSQFHQFSWDPASDFGKLLRTLWKYVQSFEDEHYQIYYKKNISEETLKDYSSAVQEIIPRLAKVQSILNQNSRGFPDMMRWTPPTAEPMNTKSVIRDGAQDCQEFAIMSKTAASKHGPVSAVGAGAIIQSALACQAAASKAAVALQRAKFNDPVCDPATVMAGNASMTTVGIVVSCGESQRRSQINHFL